MGEGANRRPEATAVATLAPAVPATSREEGGSWLAMRAMRHAVVLALLAGAGVAAVLLAAGGWEYYTTAHAVRAYSRWHKMFRPSGTAGLWFGIGGLSLMVLMHLYTARKRFRWMAGVGRVQWWLEFHIFCGIVGPILITFHTSFKFNGLVSVAYWSMLSVAISGFVGRYLYVRIPHTLRGTEMTLAEIVERAAALKAELIETTLPVDFVLRIEAIEARLTDEHLASRGLVQRLVEGVALHRKLDLLARDIRRAGYGRGLVHQALSLVEERVFLLRRIRSLERTKRLFALWHVFHRPFAYVLLVTVVIHVATVVYFGYAYPVVR